MQLAEKNLAGPVEPPAHAADRGRANALLERFEFNRALDAVWERIQVLDKDITDTEPFKVVKTDPEKGREMIARAARELHGIADELAPFMPATSDAITEAILANKKPGNLFPRL
jgi:methionyl-tRNA synthetase